MRKKYNVEGMTCAACQGHVNKAVTSLKGVKECNVNLLQNTMVVDFDEHILSSKQKPVVRMHLIYIYRLFIGLF